MWNYYFRNDICSCNGLVRATSSHQRGVFAYGFTGKMSLSKLLLFDGLAASTDLSFGGGFNSVAFKTKSWESAGIDFCFNAAFTGAAGFFQHSMSSRILDLEYEVGMRQALRDKIYSPFAQSGDILWTNGSEIMRMGIANTKKLFDAEMELMMARSTLGFFKSQTFSFGLSSFSTIPGSGSVSLTNDKQE